MNTSDTAPLHRIAIIGSGPRGLSVLERLAARIDQFGTQAQVHIYFIDSIQIGSGRIWRSTQPCWFLMNTVADEVSAFSGLHDHLPARPGAGPSLAQWWSSVDPDYPGPNSYAPRALYGRYMQFVLATIETALHGKAQLHKINGTIVDLERKGQEFTLTLDNNFVLIADKVVLVTGHAQDNLEQQRRPLLDFAAARPALRYIQGDSAADMPLDAIAPGSAVGILGLGLSFYDVMAALTEGRGGRFREGAGGALEYIASGTEPLLAAGSRSGMLLLARGRNQKDADYRYQPIIFTTQRADALRRAGPIDFGRQALPALLAEINLAYYGAAIQLRHGSAAATRFRSDIAARGVETVADVAALAAAHGVADMPSLDLDRVAHPFSGLSFDDADAFQSALLVVVESDLREAAIGNVDSCLKAGLEVIRDTRAIIRSMVDFAGLTAYSHRVDFLDWYVPRSSFLAAGPPILRVQQALALIRAGVLRIVGPGMRIESDPARGAFSLHSPQVAGSLLTVSTVIDARIPTPNLALDRSPLTKNLLRRGYWTSFVNRNGAASLDTGGVAVGKSPFHPIGSDGQACHALYVLGIPSEHTRWFMQAGSSRPAFWTDFIADADAIAADALSTVPTAPVARADETDTGRCSEVVELLE